MSTLNCFLENKGTASFLAVLLIYFLAMDVTLFLHIQDWPPLKPHQRVTLQPSFSPQNLSTTTMHPTLKPYSHFDKLSLKTIMLDPTNQYIHLALASMFDRVTRLSTTIYFITPNFISSCHLVIALVAAKLVSSERLLTRQIAVLLFEFRTFLDALDGIVARSRNHEKSEAPNLRSSGYYVDGFSDSIATLAFMVGIVYYLQRHSYLSGSYSLLPAWKSNGNDCPETKPRSSTTWSAHIYLLTANKKILGAALCFVLQLMISAGFWNRSISIYNDLLETMPTTNLQGVMQNDVLKSMLMWGIMWFWRICNAHALLEYVLFSVFIDKALEFLTWIQYLGFIMLMCLIFITETHYRYAKEYVNTSMTTL